MFHSQRTLRSYRAPPQLSICRINTREQCDTWGLLVQKQSQCPFTVPQEMCSVCSMCSQQVFSDEQRAVVLYWVQVHVAVCIKLMHGSGSGLAFGLCSQRHKSRPALELTSSSSSHSVSQQGPKILNMHFGRLLSNYYRMKCYAQPYFKRRRQVLYFVGTPCRKCIKCCLCVHLSACSIFEDTSRL